MPMAASRRHADLSEIVSLVFVMGQFMKERMHKQLQHAHAGSFIGFETLRYVRDHGRPLMRDIARHFHVTRPAATLIIDGLAEQRLLARTVDSKDRRSVRLTLTKKGKTFLEAGIARRMKEMRKIFKVLTPAERTQFAGILKKIIKSAA